MADAARVDSIDALKHFRVAMFKFAEAANTSLADSEAELHHTLNWLENEQTSFWQNQIRKRHELLERAKDALRQKQIFKDSSGRTPSAVEEEKAVRIAQARMEEAQTKFVNCKKYSRLLQREIGSYKGGIQRFVTTLELGLPTAAAALDAMVQSLEQYVMLNPEDAGAAAPPSTESPDEASAATEQPDDAGTAPG